ncbi:MAG TPA: succinate dehydrogenase assembly factor 2 [Novosphingobium sp.]|nr:succinate dehydrogenase assembly factor 2 [Novosphingobium sp.]
MDSDARLKRLKFRAWHRGTREADYVIGGFFDRYNGEWGEAEIAWFETLLEEDDPRVMAWALGTEPVPARFTGDMMTSLKKLDYVELRR